MTPTNRYVRTETTNSIVINTMLSMVSFLLVFGLGGPVRVAGVGGVAFTRAHPAARAVPLYDSAIPVSPTNHRGDDPFHRLG